MDDYLCVISGCLMTECVVTPCGHKFHKPALLTAIVRQAQCPLDRKTLDAEQLKPDEDISNKAKELLISNPDLKYKFEVNTHEYTDEEIQEVNKIVIENQGEIAEIIQKMDDLESLGRQILEWFSAKTDLGKATIITDLIKKQVRFGLRGAQNRVLYGDQDALEDDYDRYYVWINLKAYVEYFYGWKIEGKATQTFVKYNKVVLVFGEDVQVTFKRNESSEMYFQDALLINGIDTGEVFDDEACWVMIQKTDKEYRMVNKDYDDLPKVDVSLLDPLKFKRAVPLPQFV